MTDESPSPPDRTPVFLAIGFLIAVSMLVGFFVRHGADLLGFLTTVHVWMTNGGPGL